MSKLLHLTDLNTSDPFAMQLGPVKKKPAALPVQEQVKQDHQKQVSAFQAIDWSSVLEERVCNFTKWSSQKVIEETPAQEDYVPSIEQILSRRNMVIDDVMSKYHHIQSWHHLQQSNIVRLIKDTLDRNPNYRIWVKNDALLLETVTAICCEKVEILCDQAQREDLKYYGGPETIGQRRAYLAIKVINQYHAYQKQGLTKRVIEVIREIKLSFPAWQKDDPALWTRVLHDSTSCIAHQLNAAAKVDISTVASKPDPFEGQKLCSEIEMPVRPAFEADGVKNSLQDMMSYANIMAAVKKLKGHCDSVTDSSVSTNVGTQIVIQDGTIGNHSHVPITSTESIQSCPTTIMAYNPTNVSDIYRRRYLVNDGKTNLNHD